MKNFFVVIAHGLQWVGKELAKAAEWVPKVVKLADDVEADTATLMPQLTTVITDVEELAKVAVKDSAADISAAEALIAAITAAATKEGLDIAADSAVLSAFNGFIATVKDKSNYADLFAAVKKLVLDYDTLGASVKAALAKLEQDAKA